MPAPTLTESTAGLTAGCPHAARAQAEAASKAGNGHGNGHKLALNEVGIMAELDRKRRELDAREG